MLERRVCRSCACFSASALACRARLSASALACSACLSASAASARARIAEAYRLGKMRSDSGIGSSGLSLGFGFGFGFGSGFGFGFSFGLKLAREVGVGFDLAGMMGLEGKSKGVGSAQGFRHGIS